MNRISGKDLWKLIFLVSVVVLLQVNILPRLWPFEVYPDFIFILVIILAFDLDYRRSFLPIFACGLLKDIFGAHLFGFHTAVFTLEAGLIYLFSRYLSKELPGLKFIAVIVFTLFNYMLISLLLRRPYIFISLIEIFLNCLFLIPVLKFYRSLDIFTAKQKFRIGTF